MDVTEHFGKEAESPTLTDEAVDTYTDLPEVIWHSNLEVCVGVPREDNSEHDIPTSLVDDEETLTVPAEELQPSWWKRHIILLVLLAVFILGGAVAGGVAGALIAKHKLSTKAPSDQDDSAASYITLSYSFSQNNNLPIYYVEVRAAGLRSLNYPRQPRRLAHLRVHPRQDQPPIQDVRYVKLFKTPLIYIRSYD
jgi:hypothetical protein